MLSAAGFESLILQCSNQRQPFDDPQQRNSRGTRTIEGMH